MENHKHKIKHAINKEEADSSELLSFIVCNTQTINIKISKKKQNMSHHYDCNEFFFAIP